MVEDTWPRRQVVEDTRLRLQMEGDTICLPPRAAVAILLEVEAEATHRVEEGTLRAGEDILLLEAEAIPPGEEACPRVDVVVTVRRRDIRLTMGLPGQTHSMKAWGLLQATQGAVVVDRQHELALQVLQATQAAVVVDRQHEHALQEGILEAIIILPLVVLRPIPV